MIPSEQDCIDILVRQGAPDRVIKHVCTVTVLAVTIAQRCGADVPLVQAGGLLHDIGRTRTHGLRHGVEGAFLARSLDLPEPLVLIIQKHVGAGITREEAAAHGLPDLDYVPATVEEKIVCHADNLVDDDAFITSARSYQDFLRKSLLTGGESMLRMHRELSGLCGQDIDDIARSIDIRSWGGPCARYLSMAIKKWE